MPKVKDLNLHGSTFFVCKNCDTLFTGLRGLSGGAPCPKCSKPLLMISEITPKYKEYEADGRTT